LGYDSNAHKTSPSANDTLLKQTTFMNNNFEPGSILSQHDYAKSDKRNNELGLIAALCVGTLAFFVLKLLGAI
jgi:hypothetical protein